MATTLNALVMRVSAETDQLEQSMRDVRRDVNRVNRTFRDMKSETEKVEEQIGSLVRRFKAGKISAEQYESAMGHLAAKHREARIAAGGLSGQMAKLSGIITPQRAALVVLASAAGAAALAIRQVAREFANALRTMGELDPIIKGSRSINALVGDVQALSFALGEVAGMTEERTVKALQNLQRIVGQAKLEGGTAAKAFSQLGLSARNLANMTPTDQFNAVAKALQNIGSASERARIAQQLFGREGRDIVNGLLTQAETLDEAQQAAREFGLTLSQPQATAIEAANDAVGRLSAHLEGIRRQFAAELAPAVKVFADELNEIIPLGNDLKRTLQVITASLVAAVGLLMDAVKIGNALRNLAKGSTAGVADAIEIATQGPLANVDRLLERYQEAVVAAQKAAAADRDRANQTQQAEESVGNMANDANRLADSFEQQAANLNYQKNVLESGEKVAKRLQRQAEGYSDTQIRILESREAQVAALKEEQKLVDDANKKLDDYMKRGQQMMDNASPMRAVEKQLADLNVLLRVGAINEATFFKERNKILAEQVKDIAGAGPAESVQAGSAKAAEMLQQRMADEQNEQVAKLEEVRLQNELQTNVQRETNRLLKELRPVGTLR